MKNILLLIHDDAGQEARFQVALDVTRGLKGHLTCLDVCVPTIIPDDGLGTHAAVFLLEDERVREAANKAVIERRLAVEGVPWTWLDATGYIAPCLEEACALADLIVVNRRLDAFPIPDYRDVAADLVLQARKPILAVPDRAEGVDLFGHAVVAWDGSRPAMAALEAAVPLLRLAAEVTVIEVDDGSIAAPADQAAAYLSRHGIHADIERYEGGEAAAILLDQCISGCFAYLVMGGFSHRRFVEALFGGVTRRLLSESPIPIVLAY